jgi:hypothetical protein
MVVESVGVIEKNAPTVAAKITMAADLRERDGGASTTASVVCNIARLPYTKSH